jgi:two-component system phosphate regulon response regulator PhoB
MRTPEVALYELCVGSLRLNLVEQTAEARGQRAELTGHGWRILLRLALERGATVSPEELCRFAGIQDSPTHSNLQTEVWRLKRRLGQAADLLDTVRGSGYRISLETPTLSAQEARNARLRAS